MKQYVNFFDICKELILTTLREQWNKIRFLENIFHGLYLKSKIWPHIVITVNDCNLTGPKTPA